MRARPPFIGIIAGGVLVILDGGMTGDDMPTGAIVDWGNATAPAGWLILDGNTYNRADYPDLWAILNPANGGIGGTGNGSTTFTVPDLRGRITIGKRDSGTGTTLGGVFGAIDHAHTVDPPATNSAAHGGASNQEVDSIPLMGGAFVSQSSHVHSVNIGNFNSGTSNPPCLVTHKIIKT